MTDNDYYGPYDEGTVEAFLTEAATYLRDSSQCVISAIIALDEARDITPSGSSSIDEMKGLRAVMSRRFDALRCLADDVDRLRDKTVREARP